MINSGRGRPRKVPAEDKATVTIGFVIAAEVAAEIDFKINQKEYKNRTEFMKQAIDKLLHLKKDPPTTKNAFTAFVNATDTWLKYHEKCVDISDCLNCPIDEECSTMTDLSRRISELISKAKELKSTDDLSRIIQALEMIEED